MSTHIHEINISITSMCNNLYETIIIIIIIINTFIIIISSIITIIIIALFVFCVLVGVSYKDSLHYTTNNASLLRTFTIANRYVIFTLT